MAMRMRNDPLGVLRQLRTQRWRTIEALSGLPDEQLTVHVGLDRPSDVRATLLALAQDDDGRRVALEGTLAALGWQRTEAQRILPGLALTRGHLRAALVGLRDAQLDQAPGPDEWGVRQTLRHVMNNENRFIADAAYAVERLDSYQQLPLQRPGEPAAAGSLGPEVPGGMADVLDALEAVRDRLTKSAALLTAEELGAPMPWAGLTVDVRFMLHRRASHERQHTVQVQKILRGIGFSQTEAQMLLGEAEIARGALEGLLLGLPEALMSLDPGNGLTTVTDILTAARIQEEARVAAVLAALP